MEIFMKFGARGQSTPPTTCHVPKRSEPWGMCKSPGLVPRPRVPRGTLTGDMGEAVAGAAAQLMLV
jgi:hypothetical protein